MSENDTRLVDELTAAARAALPALRVAPSVQKDAALRAFARLLRAEQAALAAANERDLGAVAGETKAFRDRLTLDPERIEGMAAGVEVVAALPDPVGETVTAWRRPNGLEIAQVRVPLGVIGVVYESRPNVTADAAALCLQAGN